jgi:hypothetical protein
LFIVGQVLIYNKQKQIIIICLKHTRKNNYYPSTTLNKEELSPVYNKQQGSIITCIQRTTKKEVLPVYNDKIKELLPA